MNLIGYFETIPSAHRALIIAGGITFFWMIESIIPLVRFRYAKWKHALPNLLFTLSTVAVNLAFAFAIVLAADYTTTHQWGLLHLAPLPTWLYVLLGIMWLDFLGAWLVHLVEHKIKWMWKFHVVHHSDRHVDTTTANRHHPVESVFRASFTLLAVCLGGTPIYLVMMYQSLSVVLSQFNHANISLPAKLDHIVSWIIVSPNMHKVHHHYLQPWTDTNYGNIFSIWDRLFRTFAFTKNPAQEIEYGIDLLMDEKESQQIGNLLAMPFRKYKPIPGSKFQ